MENMILANLASEEIMSSLAELDFNTFDSKQTVFSPEILAAAERRARVADWFEPAKPVAQDLKAILATVLLSAYALYNEDASSQEIYPADDLREAMKSFSKLVAKQGTTSLNATLMRQIVGTVNKAIQNINSGLIYVYASDLGMRDDIMVWAEALELFSKPHEPSAMGRTGAQILAFPVRRKPVPAPMKPVYEGLFPTLETIIRAAEQATVAVDPRERRECLQTAQAAAEITLYRCQHALPYHEQPYAISADLEAAELAASFTSDVAELALGRGTAQASREWLSVAFKVRAKIMPELRRLSR